MLFVLLSLLSPVPTPAVDVDHVPELTSAMASIRKGQPDAAIATVDTIIVDFTKQQAAESRQVYCGMSLAESLMYMTIAAKQKRGAVAFSGSYCTALFIKGFGLIDLHRLPEARSYYERAIALAPLNAHFATELGQTYRIEKNWPVMLEKCTSAANMVQFAPENQTKIVQTAAWRCMGFALTEQHKLDEAAALYQKCLALDPNDARAKHELEFIAQQKAKQP